MLHNSAEKLNQYLQENLAKAHITRIRSHITYYVKL